MKNLKQLFVDVESDGQVWILSRSDESTPIIKMSQPEDEDGNILDSEEYKELAEEICNRYNDES